MSCLNAQPAIRPKNVESPIGVLIGLSTEGRIDDAHGRRMRTECRRDQ
jgi:hypothetical protein